MQHEGNAAGRNLLTAAQVRQRFGNISDMTLWRWLKGELQFPQPIVINRRRYWPENEINAWERARASTREAA